MSYQPIDFLRYVIKDSSSLNSAENSPNKDNNRDSCIIGDHASYPIIDSVEKISDILRNTLLKLAKEAREKKRVTPDALQIIILNICTDRM
jgi:hypothetical protein